MADLTDLAVQSNSIAQQYNPEFAGFNASIQARSTPFNGFADFVANTNALNRQIAANKEALDKQLADKQRDRDLQIKLQQNSHDHAKKMHDLELDARYVLSGGKYDVNTLSRNQKLAEIYDILRKDQNNQTTSRINGENNTPYNKNMPASFQNFVTNPNNQALSHYNSQQMVDFLTNSPSFNYLTPELKQLVQNYQEPGGTYNLSPEQIEQLKKLTNIAQANNHTQTIPNNDIFTNLYLNRNKILPEVYNLPDNPKSYLFGLIQTNTNPRDYHNKISNARNKYVKENSINFDDIRLIDKKYSKQILKQSGLPGTIYDLNNLFYDKASDKYLIYNKKSGEFDYF